MAISDFLNPGDEDEIEASCARQGCYATAVRRLDLGAEHVWLCEAHYRQTAAWHGRRDREAD